MLVYLAIELVYAPSSWTNFINSDTVGFLPMTLLFGLWPISVLGKKAKLIKFVFDVVGRECSVVNFMTLQF